MKNFGTPFETDPHQAVLRMARIKAHKALANYWTNYFDGEPIDPLAQRQADDRRALASYERQREDVWTSNL